MNFFLFLTNINTVAVHFCFVFRDDFCFVSFCLDKMQQNKSSSVSKPTIKSKVKSNNCIAASVAKSDVKKSKSTVSGQQHIDPSFRVYFNTFSPKENLTHIKRKVLLKQTKSMQQIISIASNKSNLENKTFFNSIAKAVSFVNDNMANSTNAIGNQNNANSLQAKSVNNLKVWISDFNCIIFIYCKFDSNQTKSTKQNT